MDTITLIWSGSLEDHPIGGYREKIQLPFASMEEAKIVWEELCEKLVQGRSSSTG